MERTHISSGPVSQDTATPGIIRLVIVSTATDDTA